MTGVTIIQLSPVELQGMLDDAVSRAVEAAAKKTGETWRVRDLAEHYGVAERTILNREKAGDLPPRSGRYWVRADVLRWDRDRATASSGAH
ncbi:MAG: hypothetical protein QM586_11680 [Xenophilus sp.]